MDAPIFIVELTPESLEAVKRLKDLPYKIPLAMKRGVDAAMPQVIADIKSNRLSGKGPFPPSQHRLGEVTGALKGAVVPLPSRTEVTETTATVTGGLTVPGIIYAPVHEFGFVGSESVRPFVRRLTVQRQVLTERGILSGRSRKRSVTTSREVNVRGFTRNMNIPARAPFRTGMAENLPKIRAAINVELGRALENL
jgi:hypothetical protein